MIDLNFRPLEDKLNSMFGASVFDKTKELYSGNTKGSQLLQLNRFL